MSKVERQEKHASGMEGMEESQENQTKREKEIQRKESIWRESGSICSSEFGRVKGN